MAVSTDTLSDTGGYQKLRFEPIPTLKLNQIRNFVKLDQYDRLTKYFGVNPDNGQMSNADSLMTP